MKDTVARLRTRIEKYNETDRAELRSQIAAQIVELLDTALALKWVVEASEEEVTYLDDFVAPREYPHESARGQGWCCYHACLSPNGKEFTDQMTKLWTIYKPTNKTLYYHPECWREESKTYKRRKAEQAKLPLEPDHKDEDDKDYD